MSEQELLFSLFALLRNVIYLVIGLAVLVGAVGLTYRYMNKSVGVNFKEHAWNAIRKDPMAIALYFGLRVLGVTIAGGLIASAFLK